MNTPTENPPPVEAVSKPTVELDSARLKGLTKQLAEDVRPIVERLNAVPDAARPLFERARPWADVFLPLVDEMRPLFDDLRPVMHDLRWLLGELLSRVRAAAARLAVRRDLGAIVGVGRIVGTGARGLLSVRPSVPFPAPSLSLPAMRVPQVTPVMRVPSGRPRMVASAGAFARRLRPGRWAFRTIAIGLIAFVVGDASLREAMVAEVNWTRSVLQTVEMPAIQVPTVELPTIQIPTIELPNIQIPNIELPAFQFPKQESAAPSKLVPAQFEVPPLNAYRAAFESQASYPTVSPNATVEWVIALRNTGSAGWYRGIAGAQASLALTDGTEAAVQTTAYVAPGQVGWFIARFRAPAGPGAHAVALFPRIDGRGELPNLGIYTLVTVR
ncbi:MAG: hypothetical protein M3O80_00405 [Chloroflexota bacterium]|nr:hypothetical protein [Chloroflexota bacterium]